MSESKTAARPLAERITQRKEGFTAQMYVNEKQTLYASDRIGVTAEWDLAHLNMCGLKTSVCEANAELIAEAFNVTHETGRTPRELAEDVRELRAALEPFLSGADAMGWDTTKARAILAKTGSKQP